MASDFVKDYVIYEEPRRILKNVSNVTLLKRRKKKKPSRQEKFFSGITLVR